MDSSICTLLIDSRITLNHRVGNRYNTWITNHTVGLIAPQMPYGQTALLVVDVEHSVDYAVHLLWLQNRIQGHSGTISIPQ